MNAIAQMTTAEMVVEYNTIMAKSIKKFSSRAAGEKQLANARKSHKENTMDKKPYVLADGCPACGVKADQTYAGAENTPAGERMFCHHCSTEYYQNGERYNAPAKSAARSTAIAKSWGNADTALSRARRDSVVVAGVGEFRSLAAAFKKLNLPMSRHIKFRMQLKNAGNAAFDKYQFKIVK